MELKKERSWKIEELKKNRWLAMQTKEFGWVAGYILAKSKNKLSVRILRRQINITPSTTDINSWEMCNAVTCAYFFEANNFPRIIPMPYKQFRSDIKAL